MTRYIFVCGGVISGVGKGVATASIGAILKSKGFRVSAVKIDPYLNVDAGTMNPIEHGEVFVTEDGEETDQDLGHYERFLDINIPAVNYMTSGKVYLSVIQRERNLEYDGRCVETIPHIPEEVIRRLTKAAQKSKADFLLVEIGGTVGEYQNNVFFEAGRRMKLKDPDKVIFVLVTYLPIPAKLGEMKTKPTQMAIRTLNSLGVQPDIVLARAQVPLDEPRKRKISIFGNVDKKDVISAPDIDSIYEVPINFEKENLGNRILAKFGLKPRPSKLTAWRNLVKTIKTAKDPIKIGIVGKYFKTGNFILADSYISVIEAVKAAVWHFGKKPEISWLNSEKYEKDRAKLTELKNFDAVIMAIRRYRHKLKFAKGIEEKIADILRNSKVEMRTGINVYILKDIELNAKQLSDAYAHVIKGFNYYLIITQKGLNLPNLIKKHTNLVEIRIKSPAEIESTAGIVFVIYQKLFEHSINIVETYSCLLYTSPSPRD